MLSKYDDYPIHQTDRGLEEIASQDPNWEEAIYFNIHDRAGEFSAVCGLDVFPNAQYVAGWLTVVHGGEHSSCMFAGPLGNWREELRAGTLFFAIVDPMREWRLELADEANGIRGALDFRARCPAYHFRPIRHESAGEVVFSQSYYNQAGLYHGSFAIGDRVFTDLWGLRARRWGVLSAGSLPFYNWVSIELPDRCITAWQFETPDGEILYCDGAIVKEQGDILPITRINHDWTLPPGARHPSRARLELISAAGESAYVECRELGSHFIGASPGRWLQSDPAALASAARDALSIEEYCDFMIGNERGIGILDVVSRHGYRRYGLSPLGA
jgi:hypothetical protein